mmetsp:Transcript_650/g.2168  ORF Transcript_650/g.2168 Transcript_650/m.2168 type:complete len:199 (+) Transcript_650:344-940(+)
MKVSQITAIVCLWFLMMTAVLVGLTLAGYNPVIELYHMRRLIAVRLWYKVNVVIAACGYLAMVMQFSLSGKREDMAQVLAMFCFAGHFTVSLSRCIKNNETFPAGFLLCYMTIFSLVLRDRLVRLGMMPKLSELSGGMVTWLRGAWTRVITLLNRFSVDEELALVGKPDYLQTAKDVIAEEERLTDDKTTTEKLLEFW